MLSGWTPVGRDAIQGADVVSEVAEEVISLAILKTTALNISMFAGVAIVADDWRRSPNGPPGN